MLKLAKNQRIFIFGASALSLGCVLAYSLLAPSPRFQAEPILEIPAMPEVAIEIRVTEHQVIQGSSIGQSLRQAGVPSAEIPKIIAASHPIRNLAKVARGTPFKIDWIDVPETLPTKIRIQFHPTEELHIEKSSHWTAVLLKRELQLSTQTFTGEVTTSLWDSAVSAGMDPQLIIDLASIFAWQIDFNREVRQNDKWRIVVEKQFVDEKFIGWGSILAAEYVKETDSFSAVRFEDQGKPSYFAPDGSSLRRLFLKSPMKFGRISSTFQAKRMHPILGRNIPHNGVDYAAPVGTPIMSVGKGRVTFAGRNGGSGIMIKIQHNSTYTTAYLHLSRIAAKIRKGVEVDQGDIIGYVGATGLATGPHLHFAFYENKVFVDPLSKKFPSADPVSPARMIEFKAQATSLLERLPSWKIASDTPQKATDI